MLICMGDGWLVWGKEQDYAIARRWVNVRRTISKG
jgi:hypothetical protein